MLYFLLTGLVLSIPAIEELPGGEFAAAIVDMASGEVLASTGEGLFLVGDGMPFAGVPCTVSLDEAVDSLSSLYSVSTDLSCLPASPEMGDGLTADVAGGWELHGWVDTGEGYRSFLLIARSKEGRDLGLVLLSRDLCCPGKADLAMMLLWNAAEGL
jgi:hypothetical protein